MPAKEARLGMKCGRSLPGNRVACQTRQSAIVQGCRRPASHPVRSDVREWRGARAKSRVEQWFALVFALASQRRRVWRANRAMGSPWALAFRPSEAHRRAAVLGPRQVGSHLHRQGIARSRRARGRTSPFALCALRERLAPNALVWFRTCETFGASAGHDFARAWTDFSGAGQRDTPS